MGSNSNNFREQFCPYTSLDQNVASIKLLPVNNKCHELKVQYLPVNNTLKMDGTADAGYSSPVNFNVTSDSDEDVIEDSINDSPVVRGKINKRAALIESSDGEHSFSETSVIAESPEQSGELQISSGSLQQSHINVSVSSSMEDPNISAESSFRSRGSSDSPLQVVNASVSSVGSLTSMSDDSIVCINNSHDISAMRKRSNGMEESLTTSCSNLSSASKNSLSEASCLSLGTSYSSTSSEPSRQIKYLFDPKCRTSGSQEDRSEQGILKKKIEEKTKVYNSLDRAIHGCNPKLLKDGGQLLLQRKETCFRQLEELKAQLSSLQSSDTDVIPEAKTSHVPMFSAKDQDIANLGKKALEAHRVQRALTLDTLVTLHSSLESCPAPNCFEDDPEGLKVKLMPHQKHALAWLLWREKQKPQGGILADDMGLGKTLTLISLVVRSEELRADVENRENQPWLSAKKHDKLYSGYTLVVCPATLIGQWENEIKRHCKRNLLRVLVHHGSNREERGKSLTKYDIVITTYGIVAQESKSSQKSALFRVHWDRIILDEAHVIRNPKTQQSKGVCELEGDRRWCLTGTPIHNKELDFYALLKFLRCSPFDDLSVWKQWVDNKSAIGTERLNTVVKSILLRRTKEELKSLGELEGLPKKEIIPLNIELDKEELEVYQEVLQFSKTLLAQYLHQKEEKSNGGFGLSSSKLDSVKQRLGNFQDIKTHEILVLLLRLRQICCVPGLIQNMLSNEEWKVDNLAGEEDGLVEDLLSQVSRLSIAVPSGGYSSPNESKEDSLNKLLTRNNPVFVIDRPSKKVRTLVEQLREMLSTGDKVVIVSQWSTLLHLLNDHVKSLGVRVVILDGQVPVKDRSQMIDEFNKTDSGPRIMLLSLTVGGVGLNLVGANRLVIFEPHWNPQLEAQACDRVYRVGQKKPVFIYKVICKDTIEERIEQLQKKKLELASNVLKAEATRQVTKLSLADLKTLFDVET